MNSREVLKSNFQIMYEELHTLIGEYVRNTSDELLGRKVEAYLAATIHALADYSCRFLEPSPFLTAFNYINNTIKHADGFVTYKQVVGGIGFPIVFPLQMRPIEVVWKKVDLDCWHVNQKKAYEELLEGKIILDTLKPIVKEILGENDV